MRLCVCLVLLNICFACFGQTLSVFAASSLIAPFTELATLFEQNHESVTVDLHFAGSSLLVTQIEQGAQADVIATADQLSMNRLQAVEENFLFASNKMIIITNHNAITTLADLATQRYFLILANKNVPAGSYARASLTNLNEVLGEGFSDAVLKNLVSEETNVKRALAKVRFAEADVAIVYETDVDSDASLFVIEIPDAANVRALYPIAVAPDTKHADLASDFVSFVLSAQGQQVMQSHGFGLP